MSSHPGIAHTVLQLGGLAACFRKLIILPVTDKRFLSFKGFYHGRNKSSMSVYKTRIVRLIDDYYSEIDEIRFLDVHSLYDPCGIQFPFSDEPADAGQRNESRQVYSLNAN